MRSCVLVAAKVLRQISQPSHVDPAASNVHHDPPAVRTAFHVPVRFDDVLEGELVIDLRSQQSVAGKLVDGLQCFRNGLPVLRDVQLYLAGRFLMEIRQTQEAEPFFEKLVTVADASDDADPAWLYRGLDQLAEIRSLMPAGYDKARGTLERLIALREKHQGKTHHDLIRPLRMLAKVRRFEGEPYNQRVLDIERAHHVEDHPSVLRARLELARFYADHGKNGQALPSLDGFMASIRRIDPRKGNSPDLLPALFLKSRVLAGNDNYAEAARHLQRAYEILSSQPGVTNENRVALLQSQLVRFELTSTGSLSWLNDEHLAQLAEATYQQQVASKSLPPELGLVLKLELVDRALKRNPLNTWSDGIDHQARKDSITRAAREALKVSERHWPANDPVRQQLSQLLAKLQ